MSNIEWTDKTWQVTAGCKMVSPGCANCYAQTMANRLRGMAAKDVAAGRDPKGKGPYLHVLNDAMKWNGTCAPIPENLAIPLKWKRPRMIFVNSMSDLFHEDVPFEFIDRVFAVMALCPQHTFQVLTKRPERMAEYLEGGRGSRRGRFGKIEQQCLDSYDKATATEWPLPNVWLGTSVEDQTRADERIAWLLKCHAAVRFLSVEPMLGAINLSRFTCAMDDHRVLLGHWVIVGGESGPGARPCNIEWIRSIVRQCKAAGVPCFVKQLGRNIVIRNDSLSDFPDDGNGLMWFDEDERFPRHQGSPMAIRTKHSKGGDMSEWPEDLRIREMPACYSRI